MKVEKLGEFIKILSGYPFKSALFNDEGIGLPLIRVRDVNTGFSGMYYSGEYPKEYVVCNGDILIGMDGDFNAVVWKHGAALLNQRVCKLIVDENKLNSLYLLQFLPIALKSIHKKTTFTTVKHLANKSIRAIQIPLPSLDDQVRIAGILSRAEGLIGKRKESIQLLDEFLKSTFLEMFGDPVRNEKGWEKIPLSAILIKIESGRSPVCLKRPALLGEWGVLKLGAVTKCVFNPVENKALPDIHKPNPDNEIKVGDILFSRKNTYDLVAACAYVWETPPKLMMSDLIFRLVPRDRNLVNSIFLHALLSFPTKRMEIQKLAGGAAGSMPNISKTKLLGHIIGLPPISVQKQFAIIEEKVEAIKAKYQASSEELESLYGSLSQRAFKGELDMSRVPVERIYE